MLVATFLFIVSSIASCVHVPVQSDTTICEPVNDQPHANARGDLMIIGTSGSAIQHRALFYAPINTSSPSFSNFSFNFYVAKRGSTEPINVVAFPIQSSWQEGDSNSTGGQCAPASYYDATWTFRVFGEHVKWLHAGGDFVSSAFATTTVTSPKQAYRLQSDALTRYVQTAWAQQGHNFGLILLTNTSSEYSAMAIASRENQDASVRPFFEFTV